MSEHTYEKTIERLLDSRDKAVDAWNAAIIERDEWRDLARRMRDCLDGAGKQSELVREFDRKAGA
jgi:hypothetical protein